MSDGGHGQPCSSMGKWSITPSWEMGAEATLHSWMWHSCGQSTTNPSANTWNIIQGFFTFFPLTPLSPWYVSVGRRSNGGISHWDGDAATSPPPASCSQQNFKVHFFLWEGSKSQGLPKEKTPCSGCEISHFFKLLVTLLNCSNDVINLVLAPPR